LSSPAAITFSNCTRGTGNLDEIAGHFREKRSVKSVESVAEAFLLHGDSTTV
jgi:hypothetical protein